MDFQEAARKLIGGEIDEEQFGFCAEDVKQYICAYCGVDEVPEGCQAVAARMLASAYRGGPAGGGAVKSVSRGDYSVSFTGDGRERFSSFDGRLQAFRRIKWR